MLLGMDAGARIVAEANASVVEEARELVSELIEWMKRERGNPRASFAAYIPLYASCSATLIDDTDVCKAPIRQFHGIADDWVGLPRMRKAHVTAYSRKSHVA
jgi:hypothetical protein